jgi:hypothetical protein
MLSPFHHIGGSIPATLQLLIHIFRHCTLKASGGNTNAECRLVDPRSAVSYGQYHFSQSDRGQNE